MKRLKVNTVTIHDCRVDTFCTGGKGGQKQNAKQMGVRVVHEPSGAVGECREERYQHTNKVRAFVRMAQSDTFKQWARMQAAKALTGKSVDELVDEQMASQHLLVEVRDETGRWVKASE